MSWIHPGVVNYLFIDGNYLSRLADDMGRQWFGRSAELDYKKLAWESKPKRTFYYDCLPAKKDTQQNEEFEALKAEKGQFFERLRQLDGWHVSPGVAHWRGPGKPARQKEVDVQLTVDLLTNVHRKNMEAVTLIAGDLDFRPLIEAIVREGMYVKLIHGANTNEALINAADEAQEIGPFELYEYCTDSFSRSVAVPQKTIQVGTPDGDMLEIAHQAGKDIGHLHMPTERDPCHKVAIQLATGDSRYMVYRGRDVAQLKLYAEVYRGAIEWKPLR
jgi:uncharacterized LabA/DUF88 family protein